MQGQLRIDRRPLHIQAYEHLLSLIESGAYEPGQQLPAEADLAAQLGISRPTLREALYNLEQEGVIVRRHGVGTFVSSEYGSQLESGLERLESVLQLSRRQGMKSLVRGLSVEEMPADEELAERLDVDPHTPVTCIRRTILVSRRPAAYLVDYSPAALLPPVAIDPSFSGSILDLLRHHDGVHVREALSEITALRADPFLARQLDIDPGEALLLLTETLFGKGQEPIDFSRNYFVPDRFRFHVLRR